MEDPAAETSCKIHLLKSSRSWTFLQFNDIIHTRWSCVPCSTKPKGRISLDHTCTSHSLHTIYIPFFYIPFQKVERPTPSSLDMACSTVNMQRKSCVHSCWHTTDPVKYQSFLLQKTSSRISLAKRHFYVYKAHLQYV